MPDWTRIKDNVRGSFRYLGKEARALPSHLRVLHNHLYGYGSGNYMDWFNYRKGLLQEFTARHRRLHFLERFLPPLERRAARKQEKWDMAVRSSTAYWSDRRELENQLVAEHQKAEKLEKEAEKLERKASRLETRVEELEKDSRLRLGQHMMEESQCGIIELDRDNMVVIANRNACAYLGVELEELIGRQPSDVVRAEEIFSRYAALFEAGAEQFVRREMRFQPNTFELRGVPLNIMAYASNLGTGKFPVYGGGFIVLSPYKPPQGKLASIFARQKAVVHVSGVVNIDNVLQDCMIPLMNAGKRPVYVDFKKLRSITQTALNTLSKCYHALKNQGVACVFKNVPGEVAEYLVGEKSVDESHVRDIRWRSKAALAYEKAF